MIKVANFDALTFHHHCHYHFGGYKYSTYPDFTNVETETQGKNVFGSKHLNRKDSIGVKNKGSRARQSEF